MVKGQAAWTVALVSGSWQHADQMRQIARTMERLRARMTSQSVATPAEPSSSPATQVRGV